MKFISVRHDTKVMTSVFSLSSKMAPERDFGGTAFWGPTCMAPLKTRWCYVNSVSSCKRPKPAALKCWRIGSVPLDNDFSSYSSELAVGGEGGVLGGSPYRV